jgi:zinc protease
MARRVALLLLLAAALPARLAAAPDIRHWTTERGARVYFVAAHELPIVDVEVAFAAGSAFDPAGRFGLALLTSTLLDEGAGGAHADAVGYEFERVGAAYGVNADFDSAYATLRSLKDPEKLEVALANFRRVLAQPDFPEDALDRQKKRFLIGLQHKQQSPGAIAGDAFALAIYGTHPYAHPGEGDAESLARITRADVAAFHTRHYTAANAVIAVVGDLKLGEARRIARDIARALPRGPAPAAPPEVPALAEAKTVRIAHPSAQMHILTGAPVMAIADPDYFPLYVGNYTLGGGGLVSRLFDEIREQRGLSYSAHSSFSARRRAGPFVAGLQTRADQAEGALAVLRDCIRRFIAEGPTAAELEAAKKNITGGFPLRIDSNRKILNYVAFIGFYGLPLDYLDTFSAKVQAVTVEQIRDAFRRRLDPDRMATIMVGPADPGVAGD